MRKQEPDFNLLKKLTTTNTINADDTAVIFYDIDLILERLNRLEKHFPRNTIHAVAVKACPLPNMLKILARAGMGAEAASLPELLIALSSGFSPERIVFDSPVKTKKEIQFALSAGVKINADSIYELERISSLLKKGKSKSRIGIRINPQAGSGKIELTSVAGEYSKFGVPIKEFRKELIACFVKYEWLRGVHLHIGSQGCSPEMMLAGIKTVHEFVQEGNAVLKSTGSERKINLFDIGGGFPVSYEKGIDPPSIIIYSNEIRRRFPDLMGSGITLITEFGRWIFANAGWTASRVEYVKRQSKINTAMIHVGADLFLRRAYFPQQWHHEFSLVGSNGKLKTGSDKNKYMIAGPLCFAGDMMARNISLPAVEEGDWIIIHDTGAYTISMWSRYNSRQIPKVIGYYGKGKKSRILKARETPEDLIRFWK